VTRRLPAVQAVDLMPTEDEKQLGRYWIGKLKDRILHRTYPVCGDDCPTCRLGIDHEPGALW
jgi:hypothetical protein